MNPDFRKEIEKSDKLATLVREFPGKNCGNTECNELCAEALKIAKQLNANPKQLIDEIIQNDIAPKYKCRSIGGNNRNVCRFGYTIIKSNLKNKVEDKAISLADNRYKRIIAKRFFSKTNACKECQTKDGIIISIDDFQSEYKMKKRGFWKQKDGIFRPHPNCNCLWINILIDESLKYAMQEREKIIQKAKEENTRQKGHKYAKADACGTQADELASAIYNLNLAFWSPKVVLGTKMNAVSRAVVNLVRGQTQHHAVVVLSKINQKYSFMLDSYKNDVSGKRSFSNWLAEYGMDPVSKFKIMNSNAEIQDQINENQ